MSQENAPGTNVYATLARHGGLSYLEIPAVNPQQSATFYGNVVGWKIDQRSADDFRFEDPTGHLLGRWIIGHAISRAPGLLPYMYVNRIDDAVKEATTHGGEIATAVHFEGDLWIAKVRDPAGNLIGLWQAGPR